MLTYLQFTRVAYVVRRAIFDNRYLGSHQQILGASSLVIKAHNPIQINSHNNHRRFAPGIMAMEAVTIFFPCYQLVVSKRERDRFLGELQAWNEKKTNSGQGSDSAPLRTPSEASRVPEGYSRGALERCLEENSSSLLRFAAAKEFSGENILFLNYVRDWKAAWAKIGESSPEYDWTRDPQYHRLHFFKIALEIYVFCVDMNLAEFPINIESRIYSDLLEMFGEACAYRNLPESYNTMAMHRKKLSTVITVEEDTQALCFDAYPHEEQSIMHIESRVPNSVVVPTNFTADAFDEAEKSIKNLVFTNTWPKFIDFSSDVSIDSK